MVWLVSRLISTRRKKNSGIIVCVGIIENLRKSVGVIQHSHSQLVKIDKVKLKKKRKTALDYWC